MKEPYIFTHKDEFFELPPEERVVHIWECLEHLEMRREIGDVSLEDIDRNVALVRHLALDVMKVIAGKLREEGAWKNKFDPRWPRYHPKSKNPLYLTGCYPPLLLCLPADPEAWKEADFDDGGQEVAEWTQTPAGQHSLPPEARAKFIAQTDEWNKVVEADRQAQADLKRSQAKLDKSRAKLAEEIKKRTPRR